MHSPPDCRRVHASEVGSHALSTDMARHAAAYRDRRILLAGDAAHVHHPVGGQGLNTGVQDAVNLGWKLAQVVNQTSPDSLLDTYHAERHPVAARVLRNTMAQMALLHRPDDRTKALRDTMSEFLNMDEPRKRFAAMMSGLDIHYHLGEGHPLLGRRMPDLGSSTWPGNQHEVWVAARCLRVQWNRIRRAECSRFRNPQPTRLTCLSSRL